MAQTPQARHQEALRQALRCQSITPVVFAARVEVRRRDLEIAISPPTPPKTPASASSASPTLRNPANRLWTKATQREAFIQHLRNWASDHDSSAYFHGSISLHPQGTVPGEVVELGRSVNCLLFDASSSDPPRKIVIRLFQSKHCRDDAQQLRKKNPAVSLDGASGDSTSRFSREEHGPILPAQHRQSISPYQLVIRSGSGWVSARQYLDKHHFANRAKTANEVVSKPLASTNTPGPAQQPTAAFLSNLVAHPPGLANQMALHQANAMFNLIAGLSPNVNNAPVPGWISLTNNNVIASANSAGSNINASSTNGVTASSATTSGQRRKSAADLARSRNTRSSVSGKDVVKISPLFRPFSRLPQELQDEILYHAIGYTGIISITRAVHVKDALLLSKAPITISKLFRISKIINEYMVAHIFRSTNFHFGMTGFTNFLWQIGPVNRSNLQNLTFRFGKTSLLHCVRWLAPDPIWELFEPPVATNPPTLTYFWRCQLQDLMKELDLLTLTVDVRDVPLADVPMLIRILKATVGGIKHIRIIDNRGPFDETKECTQGLRSRFPNMQEPTWRELGLKYYNDYKHQQWHMRHKWAIRGVDLRAPLNEWMDQDKAFFDA